MGFIKCFLFFMFLSMVIAKQKSQVKLIKAGLCTVPANRMDPSSPVTTTVSVKKVSRDLTVFNANFTIRQKYGPVAITGRSYQIQQNSARDLIFRLDKVSCNNPLAYKIIEIAKLNITKDCYCEVGVYKIENMNLNDFFWILMKTITSDGKYAYEVEFSCTKGVTSCITFIVDIRI